MDIGVPYTAVFRDVTVSAAQDFFEILAPAGAAVLVEAVKLSQNTELGDAAEEQLELRIVRGVGSVTTGSGGSTATAQPVNDNGSAAFGGTVEINNTTIMAAGSGSLETLGSESWNVRNEKWLLPPNGYGWVIPAGGRLTIECVAAPADALDVNGTAYLRQIG